MSINKIKAHVVEIQCDHCKVVERWERCYHRAHYLNRIKQNKGGGWGLKRWGDRMFSHCLGITKKYKTYCPKCVRLLNDSCIKTEFDPTYPLALQ